MVFGQTSTPFFKWLKFGRKILLSLLIDDLQAKVTPLSPEEVEFYRNAIGNKYPLMGDVWGALDGLKTTIEEAGTVSVQNAFYNEWSHGHYLSSLFLFAPDAKIRYTVYNTPGTFHDSTMAQFGLYEGMKEIFSQTGGKVVVDSAFAMPDSEFLIKSGQLDPMEALPLLEQQQAIGVCQLSEWGMRMIQAQFPQIKDKIRFEEAGDRKVIFLLMVLLYNFQTDFIGINEMLNSFMEKKTGYYAYEFDVAPSANDYLNV